MGNITNKAATPIDECFFRFISYLVEKEDYKLIKINPTIHDILTYINQEGLDDKSIIKFGSAYVFRVAKETLHQMEANTCVIEPFLRQFCYNSGTLDYSAVKDKLNQRINDRRKNSENIHLFCIAYPQLNWCKPIAAALVSLGQNPIFHTKEATMDILCAMRPSIDTHKLSKDVKDTFANKTKVALASFLTLYVCLYLKRNGYTYLKGECDPSLYPYYHRLGNKIGPNPTFTYPELISKMKNEFFHMDSDRVRAHHEMHQKGYLEEYGIKQTKANHELIMKHVYAYNYSEDLFNIYHPLSDLNGLREECLKATPNILSLFYTEDLFKSSKDRYTLPSLLSQSKCLSEYFDHEEKE